MRAALAAMLGCAGGAPGRDIPVYREYTQPIRFYDEQGALLEFGGAAPDLAALRELRESQAQETMMGKETIVELAYGHGASLFAPPAPIPGKLTPLADIGEDTGRRQKESGQNWLAKSLSLPSLGQTPDSAAETAMATGAKESGWGWLAGEMKGPAADGESPLPEDAEKLEAEPESAESNPASREDSKDANSLLPEGMHSYRGDSPMAEMSQTRKALAEFVAGTRPDYASLPATFSAATAGESIGMNRMPANRLSLDATSNSGPAATGGLWEDRSDRGAASLDLAAPKSQTWQGGWSAQSSAGSVLSRIETTPEPSTVVEDPITTYMNSRPSTTSGGYKPAWF